MHLNLCKSCGGETQRQGNYYVCRFCGNKWMIDAADDVHVVDRANAWAALRDCDFERATELFENIILKEPRGHEAYWGRALSRAGIIYVNDLNENKKVPTCNSISEESFIDDRDVEKAIELAPEDISAVYLKQAEQIERIRVEWLEKARREPPYDVFISFKDSDREKGIERTQDSIDAQDLYNGLVAEGFRVFFSRISLRNKVAEHYEPYIYNAIKTAKVMVVFGERPEYFSAVWIKNEWSRFKSRIESGEKHKNSLVVAYKNMDPAALPVVLKTRQCLNAGEMSFLPDLVRHIRRVIDESKQAEHIERVEIKGGQISKKAARIANESIETREIGAGAVAETDISEKQQLDLVKTYVKGKEWEDAEGLLENILFSNPTYAEAIWYKLRVKYRAVSDEALLRKLPDFPDGDIALIEKVMNCADKAFAATVLDMLYLSYEFLDSKTYCRILNMILPYGYDGRGTRIAEAFDAAIGDGDFTVFGLLLGTLDSGDVDAYIDYNVRYAMATRDREEKLSCLDAVLAVDEGNIQVLKLKLEQIRRVAQESELVALFEQILKYSSEPQSEVKAMIDGLAKELKSEKDCGFFKAILKYYGGELSSLKGEILSSAKKMISLGFFDDALYLYKLILTFEPDNAEVYWGICLIKAGAKSEKGIVEAEVSVKSLPEYTKYLTLVDEKRRLECMALVKKQEKWKEGKKKKKIAGIICANVAFVLVAIFVVFNFIVPAVEKTSDYNVAVDLMEKGWYSEAIDAFIALDGYKDSDEMIVACNKAIKDEKYNRAVALMDFGKYAEAIKAFEAMNGYEDSEEKITECRYNYAVKLMNDGKYSEALKQLEALDGYYDSEGKMLTCKYHLAVALMEEKKYSEAIVAFQALGGYGDSAEKITACENAIKDIAYDEAVALMEEGKYAEAIEAFETIEDYKNTYELVSKCQCYLSFTYELNSNKNGYTISGYSGEDSNIEVPSVYCGLPVTSIGSDAFSWCDSLTSITISDSVTSIGAYAFEICDSLTSVVFGENSQLTSIGSSAFSWCDSLTIITIPDSVTSIGSGAFSHCSGLTSITIPCGVTSIGDHAFSNCPGLTSITIPYGVTSIGDYAFSNCPGLTSITIPDGVTSIGSDAFSNCLGLTSITIPYGVTSIDSWAFYGCSNLRRVYYTGSEEEWKKISIDYNCNDSLTSAEIIYNYVPKGE